MAEANSRGDAGLETRDIGVRGMTCDKCVARVEKALRGLQGVKDVKVSRQEGNATISFDTRQTTIPKLHEAILKSGYQPFEK